MATINHKRGDSFSLPVTAYLDTAMSTPRDLSACSIASGMVHEETGATFAMTVTVTSATAGQYTVSAAYADTAGWALGLWAADIQITEGTDRDSTETFYINVLEDFT
jgi:hypothetical protein